MFTAQALKKVSQLLRIFSRKDPRYRLRLRSWDDFKGIPVMGRDDLKKIVDGGFTDGAFNVTATSGSTSSRLMIAHSCKAFEAHLGRLVRLYRLVGVKQGGIALNLCSYELNSGGRMMETALKRAGLGVIPLGPVSTPERIQEAARLIRLLKPVMVNAYTNQLFDLFALIGNRHSIRRCLVNGEPLWPQYRKRIERMGGVDIHDHYGAMEISGLAVARKPDDEYMQVAADGLLLEIMDNDGKFSRTGQGTLLVTDINNTCMPVIRYQVGDRVELVRRNGTLGIKVLGRTEDSLLLNGVVVVKMDLIRIVNDLIGHPRFFFILDKHPLQYYDKLVINVAGSPNKRLKDLTPVVIKALGIDNCIDIRRHQGIIPRTPNGKIKYFIDARSDK